MGHVNKAFTEWAKAQDGAGSPHCSMSQDQAHDGGWGDIVPGYADGGGGGGGGSTGLAEDDDSNPPW